jgi:hypothetical protein
MTRVYGLHEIKLKPGVKGQDLEGFVVEEVYPLPWSEDVQAYLLSGERGAEQGQYLWVFEFGSVEARDRYAPPPGQPTEEARKWLEAHAAVFDKWATFATPHPASGFLADHIMVGK